MENVSEFFSKYPSLSFKKGHVIISPSDNINNIYFLISGKVKMYSISSEGEEINLHIFKEKSYFPIMLVISNVENNYFFEAIEQCKTLVAPKKDVLEFIKNNSSELFNLVNRFSSAVNGMTKRVESLAFENSYHKVANFLVYYSKKFGPEVNLSHEEIAGWIGLKRETVSRQIEKMKREKLVSTQNKKILILNRDLLISKPRDIRH